VDSLRGRVIIGWKIWFMDGLVLDSRFNKWIDCQQKGVEVVKIFYRNNLGEVETSEYHGQEYYLLDDSLNVCKAVKIGKAMEGEKYWELYDKAKDDLEVISEMKD